MSWRDGRRCRGESGASLILVIAFLILMGAIGGAVVSSVTSGVSDRAVLDQARNRQYDADGAIETWITQIRNGATGACPSATASFPSINSGSPIHVDCTTATQVIVDSNGNLVQQRNLVFTACLKTGGGPDGVACAQSAGLTNSPIINAQVNFQGASAPLTTYIQSWSVDR